MLHEFITTNREEIIARTRMKVAERPAPRPTEAELKNGVPLFLEQLATRLRDERSSTGDLGAAAMTHGQDMLRQGFTIAQVVQGYGDVCQTVTELAIERDATISTDEFRTLNGCLDTATAEAVTEYERQRDQQVSDQGTERLGFLAHELRNFLNSAVMAYEILKRGDVGIGGSTGAVLGRSLSGLRALIDRSLAEVRLEGGIKNDEQVGLREFLEEVEIVAAFEANARGLQLTVASAKGEAVVKVDRQILASAVGNLVQNAFKFTRPNGHVSISTHVTADRVRIDVEDECGGLPPGKAEELFQPFEQRGANRTGLGLGLAISRRGVEANGGEIHVQNRPGEGCIFSIDLPRSPNHASPSNS